MNRLIQAQDFYTQEAENSDNEVKQEILSFIRGEYFQDEPTEEEEKWLLNEEEILERGEK